MFLQHPLSFLYIQFCFLYTPFSFSTTPGLPPPFVATPSTFSTPCISFGELVGAVSVLCGMGAGDSSKLYVRWVGVTWELCIALERQCGKQLVPQSCLREA